MSSRPASEATPRKELGVVREADAAQVRVVLWPPPRHSARSASASAARSGRGRRPGPNARDRRWALRRSGRLNRSNTSVGRAFSRLAGASRSSPCRIVGAPWSPALSRRSGCSRCRPGPTGPPVIKPDADRAAACHGTAGLHLAAEAAHQTLDGQAARPVLTIARHLMVGADPALRRHEPQPYATDREYVVLVAQALRVDLHHDDALTADHPHPAVRLDHQSGLLAQPEPERHGLLGAGDDQPAQPVAVRPGSGRGSRHRTGRARARPGGRGAIRPRRRRTAAPPRWCRRRSSAAKAPRRRR